MATVLMTLLFLAISTGCAQKTTRATTQTEEDRKFDIALERLYQETPPAAELAKQAKGILVFPDIHRFGLEFGWQYGQGALVFENKVVAYYSISAALFGVIMGSQTFGCAMFLMTDDAMNQLQEAAVWDFGVGLDVAIFTVGKAVNVTTTTNRKDLYVFTFGQKGLMLDLGYLQGSKIKKIGPGIE